jgi:hypothetical protein
VRPSESTVPGLAPPALHVLRPFHFLRLFFLPAPALHVLRPQWRRHHRPGRASLMASARGYTRRASTSNGWTLRFGRRGWRTVRSGLEDMRCKSRSYCPCSRIPVLPLAATRAPIFGLASGGIRRAQALPEGPNCFARNGLGLQTLSSHRERFSLRCMSCSLLRPVHVLLASPSGAYPARFSVARQQVNQVNVGDPGES